MTSNELEFIAECKHRSACARLVTLHAPMYTNDYDWCLCATCPYHEKSSNKDITKTEIENIELKKMIQNIAEHMKVYSELWIK